MRLQSLTSPATQAAGVLACLWLAPLATAQTTQPDLPPSDVPAVQPQTPSRLTWDRVCHVDVLDDRLLLVESRLSDDELERIDNYGNNEQVDGIAGTTSLSIGRRSLNISNTQKSAVRTSNVRIYLSSSSMTLTLTASSNGHGHTFEFIQAGWSPRRHSMDPGEVRISASGDDVPGGRASVAYPDFGTLLHTRPHELNRYIRPIFRQLKIDMLGPTEDEIRQVLNLPPPLQDPKPLDAKKQTALAAKVKTLSKQLGDPARAAREAAASHLSDLGPAARPLLRALDRTTLSPQQNLAVDQLLSDEHAMARPLAAERAEHLRYDVNFLLTCLYSEDELTRAAAAERVARVTGKPVAANSPLFSPMADWETRADAIEDLRDQLVPKATE